MFIRHLPPDSAVGAAMRGNDLYWSLEAHLLDDLRMAMTGSKEKPSKPHPSRPKGQRRRVDTPDRRRKLSAARKRAHARRRAIEAGEIT